MKHTRVIPEHNPKNSLGQPMKKRQEYGISYLPLAHIYMRVLQGVEMFLGAANGYWQGTTSGLLEDVKELRITMFFLVPRICQKIVEGIQSKIESSSAITKFLFDKAYASRKTFWEKKRLEYNQVLLDVYNGKKTIKDIHHEINDRTCLLQRFEYPAWTWVVFRKFPPMLGSRCRLFVTGSAPVCQFHGEFLSICFNLYVFEGFGMSETAASGAVQSIHTMNFGYIGEGIEPSFMAKIRSIPDMGYTVNDKQIINFAGQSIEVNNPRGELMLKGPALFSGYWNDEQKTKESFDDGWFLTGDIAEFDVLTRQLRLIDRKRGIFKLSQGEFISINHIEDELSKSRFIESLYVYASRYQPFTLAVVVPNMAYMRQIVKDVTPENVTTNIEAIKAVLTDLKKIGKAAELKSFEIPKAIILEGDPWTPENGLLTPALKVKRPNCKDKYEALFNDMYNRLSKMDSPNTDQIAAQMVKSITDGPLDDTKSHASGGSNFTGMR